MLLYFESSHSCANDSNVRVQDGVPERKVEEWPYQLFKAKEYRALTDCLTNLAMFHRLYTPINKYDLAAYWRYRFTNVPNDADTFIGLGVSFQNPVRMLLTRIELLSVAEMCVFPSHGTAHFLTAPVQFPADVLAAELYFRVGQFLQDMGKYAGAGTHLPTLPH